MPEDKKTVEFSTNYKPFVQKCIQQALEEFGKDSKLTVNIQMDETYTLTVRVTKTN